MALMLRSHIPGGPHPWHGVISVHSAPFRRLQPFSLKSLSFAFQQPSAFVQPTIPSSLARAFATSFCVNKENLKAEIGKARRSRGDFWTEEEDAFIKDLLLTKRASTREVHEKYLPLRTRKAILYRRCVLTPPDKRTPKGLGRWTADDDERLRRLFFDEGWSVAHILPQFPSKTADAITGRCTKLRLMDGVRRTNWSAEDDAQLVGFIRQNDWIGAMHAFPYRSGSSLSTRYYGHLKERQKQQESEREEQRTGDDDSVTTEVLVKRRRVNLSSETSKPHRFHRWTPEEDALLLKYIEATPKGTNRYWKVIAERFKRKPESPTFFFPGAVRSRYKNLMAKMTTNSGPWGEEEKKRLEAAVQEQIGGGYRPFIELSAAASGKVRKTLDSDGLNPLKLGSKELLSIQWAEVAKKVGTRVGQACRAQFYANYTTGLHGRWSPEETEKLLSGYRKFGHNVEAIARFLGTRGPTQIRKKLIHLEPLR